MTEQVDEGYVVFFDLKTKVGELCTPRKHIVEGKEILSFNIEIGSAFPMTDFLLNPSNQNEFVFVCEGARLKDPREKHE